MHCVQSFINGLTFMNCPKEKLCEPFFGNLEGQAKVWYDALSVEQKSNPNVLV
jgi:hypothetical protein